MSILWFDQISAQDIERVGGKGANLGEMTRAGLPVPPGFCITSDVYRRIIGEAGVWPQIDGLLTAVANNDAAKSAHRIQRLVANAPMPADVAGAITSAYHQLDGGWAAVAVRSSATAEDLPEASFAGQQETFLGVRGQDALLNYVQQCWASLWTERAIVYRQRNGFPHEQVSLSVVVQQMVRPESAGVLFTVNPLTGKRGEMLVNAAYGLGETVVSGQVTPDSYLLTPQAKSLIVDQTVGTKEVRIDALPDGGVRKQTVAPADRQRLCLTPSQLEKLAELGEKIERHYQSPQDIEWAFTDDELYLLQTRPITSLNNIVPPAPMPRARTLSQTEHRILDDILEHYPDPPYPLDYLAVTDGYEQVQHALREAGLAVPAADTIIQMDELGIPSVEPVTPRFTWRILKILSLVQRKLGLDPGRWEAEQSAVFAGRLAALQQTDVAGLADDGLADYIETAVQTAADIARIRFSEYIVPMMVRGALLKLLVRFVNRRGTVVEADLLGSLAYKTVVIDRALHQLAAEAGQTPAVRAALLDLPMDEVMDALRETAVGRQFLQQFDVFLQAHGARTMKVYLPFSNQSWAENPASLMATFAAILRAESSPGGHRGKDDHFQQLRDNTAKGLPAFLRRRFLRTLAKYRTGHIAREATLYAIEESFVMARRGTTAAAQRLVGRGVLTAVDDILFLTLPELFAILRGASSPDGMPELITQRRQARPGATAVWQNRGETNIESGDNLLKGQPGSPGIATGTVKIIDGPAEFGKLQEGDVLVCSFTDPAWTPLFSLAAAVVADTGGSLSHAAIVAREYGIPAVLGTQVATSQLKDGMTVTVDGGRGMVIVES